MIKSTGVAKLAQHRTMDPPDRDPLRVHAGYGDRIAMIDGGRRVSYAELAERVDRVAANLLGLGLEPGDRVAIHLHNCLEAVLCCYACFRVGVIAMPVNNRLTARETGVLLRKGRPRVLVTEAALFGPLRDEPDLALPPHCYLTDAASGAGAGSFEELLEGKAEVEFSNPVPNQPSTLFFTSGTTGDPKGAVHARRHLIANVLNQNSQFAYTERDTALIFVSLCHTFALLRGTMPTLYAGSTIVLLKEFQAGPALEWMENEEVSFLVGLPAMYSLLIDEAEERGVLRRNHLRLCIASGDAVPLALHERFQAHFGLPLTESYGSTEAMMMTSNPLGEGKVVGSVGRAIAGMEVIISDQSGNTVPTNQVGEIRVKGETVMSAYFENAEATEGAFEDGWFCTGDLASMDEKGFLWFHGRRKQIIVRGGSNIVPQDVESALFEHPDVLEAGVIGIPDPVYGQRVRAYVSVKEGSEVDASDLRGFVRRFLAEYEVPEEIVFLPDLPLGASGKVDRKALQALGQRE